MAYLTESKVRAKGRLAVRAGDAKGTFKSIMESQNQVAPKTYDVFLSHSFSDFELILGIVEVLKGQNLSVYVDWLEDPNLDRNNVTSATAAKLKTRMNSCNSLIFATSNSSTTSKWMPWELGYFDGSKPGKIGVLPIVQLSDSSFKGNEYLGLYPVISVEAVSKALMFNRTLYEKVGVRTWMLRAT